MRVYFDRVLTDARMHPWTTSTNDEAGRYYDFKRYPELIRTSLEEFRPYERYRAVELFYQLLEHLNGLTSYLETNDSRLKPNGKNPDAPRIPKKFVLQSDISVLFRSLGLNLAADEPSQYSQWLIENLINSLDSRPEPIYGVIKLYLFPNKVYDGPVDPNARGGYSIVYKILAWGDSEEEQFENYKQVLEELLPYFRDLPIPP